MKRGRKGGSKAGRNEGTGKEGGREKEVGQGGKQKGCMDRQTTDLVI